MGLTLVGRVPLFFFVGLNPLRDHPSHAITPCTPIIISPVKEHLDGTVRPALAERCHALTSALREALPGCSFLEPTGGYFVWVKLPDGVSHSVAELRRGPRVREAGRARLIS